MVVLIADGKFVFYLMFEKKMLKKQTNLEKNFYQLAVEQRDRLNINPSLRKHYYLIYLQGFQRILIWSIVQTFTIYLFIQMNTVIDKAVVTVIVERQWE